MVVHWQTTETKFNIQFNLPASLFSKIDRQTKTKSTVCLFTTIFLSASNSVSFLFPSLHLLRFFFSSFHHHSPKRTKTIIIII